MIKRILSFFDGESQWIRWSVQAVFCTIVIYTGYRFAKFVSLLETGLIPDFDRPPGVEAFLPISALVSLKQFLLTGVINDIHPSALVIFLIAVLTAVFVKKGFCAWVCPIGTLSELVHRLYLKLFKRRWTVYRPLDVLLRSLKYCLLGFFLWSVLIQMPADSIAQFIQSPYHMFADIKMLHFFTQISKTAFVILIILVALSFFIQHFWCRYLCPYGALLGLIGLVGIGSIRRDPEYCTSCGRCEKVCPGSIRILIKEKVRSPECMACMSCVDHCPEEKAIGFSLFTKKIRAGALSIALIIGLLFTGGIVAAKLTGHWQNSIPKQMYLRYVLQSSFSRNMQGEMDPAKMEKMIKIMKNIQMQREKMQQMKTTFGD